MRKLITGQGTDPTIQPERQERWFDLEARAQVEVSSESPGYPVENALTPAASDGWEAAGPRAATLTLRFDTAQKLTRTLLHFVDAEHERSQEWALSANFPDGSRRELLRQGWNFSPSGSTEQREEYVLDTQPVVSVTLWIDPDRGRDRYPATLRAWRLA